MAQLGETFTGEGIADETKRGGGNTILPPAVYDVIITDTDLKPTKSGNGQVIHMDLQVVTGEHRGVGFKDYINYTNTNATAQEIGQKQFKAYALVTNTPMPINDTIQLHNKQFKIQLEVEPNNWIDSDGNERTGHRNKIVELFAANAQINNPPVQHAAGPAPVSAIANANSATGGGNVPPTTAPAANNTAPWNSN